MEAISVSICMFSSCQPPTHSFTKIQKLKARSFYGMQRRSHKSRETWRHRKTTKKHCIFNKPYQICSNLIACKPCSKHGICILNTGVISGDQNEACANMHVHPHYDVCLKRDMYCNSWVEHDARQNTCTRVARFKLQVINKGEVLAKVTWTNHVAAGCRQSNWLWGQQQVQTGKQRLQLCNCVQWETTIVPPRHPYRKEPVI